MTMEYSQNDGIDIFKNEDDNDNDIFSSNGPNLLLSSGNEINLCRHWKH